MGFLVGASIAALKIDPTRTSEDLQINSTRGSYAVPLWVVYYNLT